MDGALVLFESLIYSMSIHGAVGSKVQLVHPLAIYLQAVYEKLNPVDTTAIGISIQHIRCMHCKSKVSIHRWYGRIFQDAIAAGSFRLVIHGDRISVNECGVVHRHDPYTVDGGSNFIL